MLEGQRERKEERENDEKRISRFFYTLRIAKGGEFVEQEEGG